jgi:TatD DNase family protein
VLADSHAHLYDEAYDADRAEVIQRANAAGVRLIVAVGVDVASSQASLDIALANEGVYAAVGIHPNSANEATPEALAEIRRLASNPRVVGIGETGLDFYRDRVSAAEQRRVLAFHLALAAELGKPAIVHDREAHAEIAETVVGWARGLGGSLAKPVGVLHCFSGNLGLAREAISVGLLVSFAGNVTYRGATTIAEAAGELDLAGVLLETDCPYLSPSPLRGRRNEPSNLTLTARWAAERRGLTTEVISSATTENARRLFDI